MREGLSFCTKCGKAVFPSIQPILDETKVPRTVEITIEYLDSNQQMQANKVEIKLSPDSVKLSTAANSTFRELANLAAPGIKK